MSNALAGYCAILPTNGGHPYMFPMLPGSSRDSGRRFHKRRAASNRYGGMNVEQDWTEPTVTVLCHVQSAWFNASVLASWFLRTDGFLPSIGRLQWRLGAGETVCYAAAKVDSFALAWAGAGEPLLARIVFRPYAFRTHPARYLPVVPYGLVFNGRAITNGAGTRVASGRLDIDNRLVADHSTPTRISLDGDRYPIDYYADSPDIALTTLAYDGGAVLDALGPDQNWWVTLRFLDPTSTRGRVRGVACRIHGIAPARREVVTVGAAQVERAILATKPGALRSQIQFTSFAGGFAP